jgi:hypothetical protein
MSAFNSMNLLVQAKLNTANVDVKKIHLQHYLASLLQRTPKSVQRVNNKSNHRRSSR